MLAVKTYPQKFIDHCHELIDQQVASYRALVAAVDPAQSSVVAEFEHRFFSHLVIVLDAYFMHRTRAIEGKDSNPLNEVRMLAASILVNDGVLAADKTIKYVAATSVLGCAVGDTVRIDADRFDRLAAAYFTELTRRFGEAALSGT